ncbi:universal stress protein [Streptomyces nymphaeiformis]|uniref:Nucleotide-binding universal stress UspA family protein n=1 Tax=Streptomyces nymphaeiformis TaxID=2663842 RepID=A0A7W7XDK1_9ACTN|nr:universal stress protein [Streptomyces nymphaeiformis]MBB4984829.1 nucleotide-binding universal stress UspA family protein [Streptomyces nymphaeiformis]
MDFSDGRSHVVVGVDGSPASYAALRWAVRQARETGASLDVVGVHDVPGATGWSAPPVDAAFDAEQATKAVSEELGSVLPPRGEVPPVEQHVLRGDPAEVLIEASAGADLLVVGSRGRGGFASLLLGSVSQQRAVHASCPVVIVRADTTEAVDSADTMP